MNVLILGYSSIAQRRMIPALRRIPEVSRIDIASRSKAPVSDGGGAIFTSYADALLRSDAELVYVSLPNADHAQWTLAALKAGKHVIVDKPAFLNLEQARACVEAAAERNLLLAEATVFSFHPQIAALQEFFRTNGPLTHIDARFIIPPLPVQNFRNHAGQGGGCLLDMAPYATAVARLFSTAPLHSVVAVAAPPAAGLDIDVGFSLLARFEDGLRYSGHFSFESEYQNELTLIGKGGSITVERIFSPPADFVSTWQQRRANQSSALAQDCADVFQIFATAVIAAIAAGEHKSFATVLLHDAALRAQIAASLGYGESLT